MILECTYNISCASPRLLDFQFCLQNDQNPLKRCLYIPRKNVFTKRKEYLVKQNNINSTFSINFVKAVEFVQRQTRTVLREAQQDPHVETRQQSCERHTPNLWNYTRFFIRRIKLWENCVLGWVIHDLEISNMLDLRTVKIICTCKHTKVKPQWCLNFIDTWRSCKYV